MKTSLLLLSASTALLSGCLYVGDLKDAKFTVTYFGGDGLNTLGQAALSQSAVLVLSTGSPNESQPVGVLKAS